MSGTAPHAHAPSPAPAAGPLHGEALLPDGTYQTPYFQHGRGGGYEPFHPSQVPGLAQNSEYSEHGHWSFQPPSAEAPHLAQPWANTTAQPQPHGYLLDPHTAPGTWQGVSVLAQNPPFSPPEQIRLGNLEATPASQPPHVAVDPAANLATLQAALWQAQEAARMAEERAQHAQGSAQALLQLNKHLSAQLNNPMAQDTHPASSPPPAASTAARAPPHTEKRSRPPSMAFAHAAHGHAAWDCCSRGASPLTIMRRSTLNSTLSSSESNWPTGPISDSPATYCKGLG